MVYKWKDFDPIVVFSGTLLKLPIQAPYSQQNCGRGTANSNAFVVSAVSNLSNICRGKILISTPSFDSHLLSQVFEVDRHFKMIVTTQICGNV